MRNRIFDVLRFGTPMASVYESIIRRKYNTSGLIDHSADFPGTASAIEPEPIQRAPIWCPLWILLVCFELFAAANPVTVSIAMWMSR